MRYSIPAVVAASLVVATSLAAALPSVFDSTRAYEQLRQIVSFGPRPAGSPALDGTRKYIRQQLAAAGVQQVTDQTFTASTPVGPVRMTNLVATIPGTSPERLVFGGHYDTKLFRDFTFVGANDGGSSAAFLLELARVLKARRNPLTMEIVFLDGEEAFHPTEWQGTDHTYGSRYYVEAAKKSGTLKHLRAFILVDMIGGRDLVLERETNSTPWLMDAFIQTARRLKMNDLFADQPNAVEDDHIPFLEAGVPCADLIGFNHYYNRGWWHTSQDTLDKISARSMQEVGDLLLGTLPVIEGKLSRASSSHVRTPPRRAK